MNDRRLRFLFTTLDGGGNVAPIMAPIAQLVQRGHHVRVMSDSVNRDEADAAGASFVAWTRAPNKTARSRDLDPMDWAASSPDEALRGMVALGDPVLTGGACVSGVRSATSWRQFRGRTLNE